MTLGLWKARVRAVALTPAREAVAEKTLMPTLASMPALALMPATTLKPAVRPVRATTPMPAPLPKARMREPVRPEVPKKRGAGGLPGELRQTEVAARASNRLPVDVSETDEVGLGPDGKIVSGHGPKSGM